MLFSFSINYLNGSFLSPITCRAREEKEIIPYLHKSINKRANPCYLIVLTLPKLLLLSKSLSLASLSYLTARMSQKAAKIATNKHSVKVMGLKNDSFVSPSISKPTKPDFSKKKFKTGTSKRYRSSLMGSASIPASTPMETQEEDVNMDKVITTAVNSILEETADKVIGSDVEYDVTTS